MPGPTARYLDTIERRVTSGAGGEGLSGLLARGGRDWGRLIEAAYRQGAVFESWSDRFRLSLWVQVAQEHGRDLLAEAQREWPLDEPLPWDGIHMGVTKRFLRREAERAAEGITTEDCRWGSCPGCGACVGEARIRLHGEFGSGGGR